MAGQTIAILGGGVGGIVCANELRRLISDEHRVVLVEKDRDHAFAPSFLWLMTGARKPEEVTRPLTRLVRPGVEVMHAEAQEIDLDAGRIETTARDIIYDYLVVALGAELAPGEVQGLSESAYDFYTFDGAIRLCDALQGFLTGTVAVVVSALPYKCPAAPYEGAMLIADCLRRRGLQGKTEVQVFTPEPQPMPVAGPAMGHTVAQALLTRGITLHPLHRLTSVDPEAKALSFEARDRVQYDLLVAVPPHRGPRLVREAGLANEAGWVPVDAATLVTERDNVYALGDVTTIELPGRWQREIPLLLPKAGVFAHAQALTVARRIAARLRGGQGADTFSGGGYCALEAGAGEAGLAYGDFYAEPAPRVEMREVGSAWHLGKVLYEQWWLAPAGPRRATLSAALAIGSRALRIPVTL